MKLCKTFFIALWIILNFSLAQNQQPDRYDVNTVNSNVEINTVPILINFPYVLKTGENYKLNVDETGEAHLEGKKANSKVCDMFLFRQTSLRGGSSLGTSPIERGGSSYKQELLKGTVAYQDCQGQITLTGDSVVIELGTWYTVSYHPEIDLTVVVVLEGSVKVATIQNAALGKYEKVNSGQIWVSQPKDRIIKIDSKNTIFLDDEYIGPNIGERPIHPDGEVLNIDFLTNVLFSLREFCLDYPFERINYWANNNNVSSFPIREAKEAWNNSSSDIDFDYDYLNSCEEIKMGTNLFHYDTDGDCVNDFEEIYETYSSPREFQDWEKSECTGLPTFFGYEDEDEDRTVRRCGCSQP